MAAIRIPRLVARINGGVTSWYWQPSKTLRDQGWEPKPLGKDETSAIMQARELNEQVQLWQEGGKTPVKVRQRRKRGTMGAMIARYRREKLEGQKPDGSPLLKPKTVESYRTSLARIEEWAGKQPVTYITPARVRALRDATARPRDQGGLGHSAAFNMLRVLRQLFAFAEAVDIIPKNSNPATDFDLGAPPPRRTIWEADDDAAFDAAAYDLGMPGMALARALSLYTAQRQGDMLRFTEGQMSLLDIFDPILRERLADGDGKVWGWTFEQGKTSDEYAATQMQLPLEPEILERVQAAIRNNRARDRAEKPPRLVTYVLVDDRTGMPWKKDPFIKAYRMILDHAADRTGRENMRELVWHDLRRTRVVRLRRRAMPKEMICAITGHSLRSIEEMLRVYGPVDPTITAAAIAGSLEERKQA